MKKLDFNEMMNKLSELAHEDIELDCDAIHIPENSEVNIDDFDEDEFIFDDFLDEETKKIIFSK